MEAKLFVVFAMVVVAHSAPQPGFSYEVADANSGDYKSHSESRVGNAVYGHYTLQEPDGSKRTVSYIADEDGFNAVVRKCPAGWSRTADVAPITATTFSPDTAHAVLTAAAVRAPVDAPGKLNPAIYNAEPQITAWPYGSYLN